MARPLATCPTLPAALTQDAVATLCREGALLWAEQAAGAQTLDCAAVTVADGAGVAFLWVLQQRVRAHGGELTLAKLLPELSARLEGYAQAQTQAAASPEVLGAQPPREHPIAALGRRACEGAAAWGASVAYLGEVICALGSLFSRRFRWGDCRLAFQRCGAEAVPVSSLIGFLLGLILAFQSAIPLKMFGGEGFVGGLVGIALVRELGLIITAILMAGRTGSAFAAELGTMKVNEEIDALETMGLKPVHFLALPRIVAGTLALPFLSLFATAAGLLGGWVVMAVLGFPPQYYLDQLQAFVALGDLLGSLAKAFLFGFMVSAVGCWQGLRAGRDAGAVGTATTAAVVTGIVLLALLEGLLSGVFYAMGW